MCQPWLLLLPLLSAHLLWALYKSLSQEECQLVRCQSERRLPFHLSFLPVTEEGGRKKEGKEEEEARLHYQHTHARAGYITPWKRCWSTGKSFSSPPHTYYFFLVIWWLLSCSKDVFLKHHFCWSLRSFCLFKLTFWFHQGDICTFSWLFKFISRTNVLIDWKNEEVLIFFLLFRGGASDF